MEHFVRNKRGIKINVACCTCIYKQFYKRDDNKRMCVRLHKVVNTGDACDLWVMRPCLENAGKGNGRVHKKRDLNRLPAAVREIAEKLNRNK